MPSSQTAAPTEFRLYRRIVTAFVLLFVSLGSAYLLISVGVSIYRRRHAVPTGERVSVQLTLSEIHGCYEDLDDISQGLQKHLENFHHLLATYSTSEAQRWEDEAAVWRRQWKVLGQRCRFNEIRGARHRKELEEMAAAYDEMGVTEQIYTHALLRFGKDQAPRLDRVRNRLQKIGERLAKSESAPAGDTP